MPLDTERDALCFSPAHVVAARIAARELSAVEVVRAYLDRIEAVDGTLRAYTTVLAEQALDAAAAADGDLARGCTPGPLHGVPVAIKDLDALAGVPTSFGSRALNGRIVPARSATYVQRLVDAGAIVIGKTNVPEFGHKAVTDNLVFGPTASPFDPAANAGGSSGGAAAAVAAGLAALAQGGDGGGSIRIPAALCGVVGLKATFGRVAQAVRPDAFNTHTPFIHAGPITRTVHDSALALDVMSGPESRDPLSLPEAPPVLADVGRAVRGLRVAYLPSFGGYPVEAAVRERVDAGVEALQAAGAHVEIVERPLPLPHDEVTALWLRQMGTNYVGIVEGLARDGIDLLGELRDQVEARVIAMIEQSSALTVAEVKRDEMAATLLVDWLETLLDDHDLVVSPTLGVDHVPNGEPGTTVGPASVAGVAVDPAIGWCLTPITNFTGHPGASVPVGLSEAGHPVGLQIVAHRFADGDVVAAAAAIERLMPWRETLRPSGRRT